MKKQLRALLFLFCLAGTALLPALTTCRPGSDALMALYDANAAGSRENNSSWVNAAACNVCKGCGVTCSTKTVAK